MKNRHTIWAAVAVFAVLCFAGCAAGQTDAQTDTTDAAQTSQNGTQAETNAGTAPVQAQTPQETTAVTAPELTETPPRTPVSVGDEVSATYTANADGKLGTEPGFTERDLLQTPDLTDANYFAVSDGAVLEITGEGVYVLAGTAKNCTVKVNADDRAKVQLVLNNVNITNENFPAIYVLGADKVFVTTLDGTANALSVTGSFFSDGSVKTDAVVFSKADLVFNGLGTLTVFSSDNGISGKDGIRFTGGSYNITSKADAVEANDYIAVCGGSFTVKTSKDGFHAENEDDNKLGWILIADGSVTVDASSDGIQATSVLQIDGGDITVRGSEGLEATYVQINGGNISVTATDDGINASRKSTAYTPTVEFTGGYTKVAVGQGDTDAIDANGNIIVSGGTVDVTSTVSSFDYDGTATYTGGTIIINGQTVNSIPQSMMPGGPGGPGRGR